MRPPNLREKDIARRIREGYGQGEGEAYKPFYNTPTSDSSGRLHRLKGLTVPRVHHALSDGEWYGIETADWAVDTVDVRENFLVPRDESVEIAKARGIAHPWNHRDKAPWPMTVDVVATTVQNGRRHDNGFEIKLREDLRSPRVFELLEIKRTYFELRGGRLFLSIKENFPYKMVLAISWARQGLYVDGLADCSPTNFQKLCDATRDAVEVARFKTVGDMYRGLAAQFFVSKQTAELALKHLLVRRLVSTDMSSVVSPSCPLTRLAPSNPPHQDKVAWR